MTPAEIKDLIQAARDDLHAERLAAAKARVRAKLQCLRLAQQAVRNLEADLEDLKRELEETL